MSYPKERWLNEQRDVPVQEDVLSRLSAVSQQESHAKQAGIQPVLSWNRVVVVQARRDVDSDDTTRECGTMKSTIVTRHSNKDGLTQHFRESN